MYYSSTIYREDLANAIHSVNHYNRIKGKRFLITGATGLLGAFVIDMLMYLNDTEDAKIEVWALGRNEQRLKKRFSTHVDSSELHFIIQDVTEPLEINEKMDYILHFAGDGYPAAFSNHPVETMTPAFIGSYNLLTYASSCEGCRFMLASTGEVYGMIEQKTEITENDHGHVDLMSFRSCYSSAKRAAESLCASFTHEYDVDTVVARFSHVYGGCTSDKDNRATVQFMRKAIAGEDIIMLSEGKQMRSYTYVADAVIGAMTILLSGEKGQAYNIANKNSRITIADFAKIVAEECRVNRIFDISVNPGDTPITFAVLSTDKIEQIGYSGRYNIREGIARAIQIMKGTI